MRDVNVTHKENIDTMRLISYYDCINSKDNIVERQLCT